MPLERSLSDALTPGLFRQNISSTRGDEDDDDDDDDGEDVNEGLGYFRYFLDEAHVSALPFVEPESEINPLRLLLCDGNNSEFLINKLHEHIARIERRLEYLEMRMSKNGRDRALELRENFRENFRFSYDDWAKFENGGTSFLRDVAGTNQNNVTALFNKCWVGANRRKSANCCGSKKNAQSKCPCEEADRCKPVFSANAPTLTVLNCQKCKCCKCATPKKKSVDCAVTKTTKHTACCCRCRDNPHSVVEDSEDEEKSWCCPKLRVHRPTLWKKSPPCQCAKKMADHAHKQSKPVELDLSARRSSEVKVASDNKQSKKESEASPYNPSPSPYNPSPSPPPPTQEAPAPAPVPPPATVPTSAEPESPKKAAAKKEEDEDEEEVDGEGGEEEEEEEVELLPVLISSRHKFNRNSKPKKYRKSNTSDRSKRVKKKMLGKKPRKSYQTANDQNKADKNTSTHIAAIEEIGGSTFNQATSTKFLGPGRKKKIRVRNTVSHGDQCECDICTAWKAKMMRVLEVSPIKTEEYRTDSSLDGFQEPEDDITEMKLDTFVPQVKQAVQKMFTKRNRWHKRSCSCELCRSFEMTGSAKRSKSPKYGGRLGFSRITPRLKRMKQKFTNVIDPSGTDDELVDQYEDYVDHSTSAESLIITRKPKEHRSGKTRKKKQKRKKFELHFRSEDDYPGKQNQKNRKRKHNASFKMDNRKSYKRKGSYTEIVASEPERSWSQRSLTTCDCHNCNMARQTDGQLAWFETNHHHDGYDMSFHKFKNRDQLNEAGRTGGKKYRGASDTSSVRLNIFQKPTKKKERNIISEQCEEGLNETEAQLSSTGCEASCSGKCQLNLDPWSNFRRIGIASDNTPPSRQSKKGSLFKKIARWNTRGMERNRMHSLYTPKSKSSHADKVMEEEIQRRRPNFTEADNAQSWSDEEFDLVPKRSASVPSAPEWNS